MAMTPPLTHTHIHIAQVYRSVDSKDRVERNIQTRQTLPVDLPSRLTRLGGGGWGDYLLEIPPVMTYVVSRSDWS